MRFSLGLAPSLVTPPASLLHVVCYTSSSRAPPGRALAPAASLAALPTVSPRHLPRYACWMLKEEREARLRGKRGTWDAGVRNGRGTKSITSNSSGPRAGPEFLRARGETKIGDTYIHMN